ncbi:hypothetical protein Nepgr_007848 [Nepenthes gracilis]|uniref:Uncharacterized protein n=1 Tax=Nepenthes gracilis TaxID=150966 RepID=A0AAD3S7S5_NEPGR|nr:hypothetical protein Nepgr_007848 [Nepenthes gracilis]
MVICRSVVLLWWLFSLVLALFSVFEQIRVVMPYADAKQSIDGSFHSTEVNEPLSEAALKCRNGFWSLVDLGEQQFSMLVDIFTVSADIPRWVGGSPSGQVSLSSQSGIPTRVVCELGPLGPVSTVALSLPGVPGSQVLVIVRLAPRLGPRLTSPARPLRLRLLACQVDTQIQIGDDLGCPCDQPDAIVIPSGSPAPAGSLVAADRPLWSSVVK